MPFFPGPIHIEAVPSILISAQIVKFNIWASWAEIKMPRTASIWVGPGKKGIQGSYTIIRKIFRGGRTKTNPVPKLSPPPTEGEGESDSVFPPHPSCHASLRSPSFASLRSHANIVQCAASLHTLFFWGGGGSLSKILKNRDKERRKLKK
jgi:hypothetical protein